jgi:KaiC/GvpD/RAD55 family RecA-like ATPase
MESEQYRLFEESGVSRGVVDEMQIGYNGRYLVYPYFLENGNCYAARCLNPHMEDDHFWHGDEASFAEDSRIFNLPDIGRCEDGTLFVTDDEKSLLCLRELGYPGIAVPTSTDLEAIPPERLAFIRHVLIVTTHVPEAGLAARELATRLGYKARVLTWPVSEKRGYRLWELAAAKGKGFRSAFQAMLRKAKSFSPFASPEKEQQTFYQQLERDKGKRLLGFATGLRRMDHALKGIRGINILGGQPKVGKSCFLMQLSTEVAKRKIPVIYYDFENGRQKIYTRTLCRLSRLPEEKLREEELDLETSGRLNRAFDQFREILTYFRVVTDRKLNPELMRRQIDFLQHETRQRAALVVVDSLHKLPFKNLSERRTGIDEWLRHMEAIRDEQDVSFLVVSELSRSEGGKYSRKPDLGAFKESGDIEYSADNAMVFLPDWDPFDSVSTNERRGVLWLVASRESNPGKVAEFVLEYPFWGFREV